MTVADLEAIVERLSDIKREVMGQLRDVEADLCEAKLALAQVRAHQPKQAR
ncbi:hypothetical protein [Hyphomicrobium sp. CS1GBMeth3]|uniref:hypothetical protein n=1 Tax=Hyphomicrobium sp. CS1GBMeth3 TaxID=1892845 RepID=UPI000A9A72DD|nr:hypothetical protein [Hyphomicrobium sp. CS1GBMeth3]